MFHTVSQCFTGVTCFASSPGCAKLCAELLSEGSSSAGQRQKLRREALHALKTIHKLCQKKDGLPSDVSAAVAEALLGIRDATPSQQRRGEAGHIEVKEGLKFK